MRKRAVPLEGMYDGTFLCLDGTVVNWAYHEALMRCEGRRRERTDIRATAFVTYTRPPYDADVASKRPVVLWLTIFVHPDIIRENG